MGPRLDLQTLLEGVLGTRNVYFQPPSNVRMKYPAIVYQLDSALSEFADNMPYSYSKRYQVTVVDQDPDSDIPDKIAGLPMCVLNRSYVADNLHHYVFNLYF